MDFELALELLKSKGCRVLPERGNFKFFLNKDKHGYNFIIIPDDPIYSIVMLGFDEKKAANLRDQLDQLLNKSKEKKKVIPLIEKEFGMKPTSISECEDKDMLRKWEYIAKVLRNLNAPSKIINAAQEIDNILVNLGLNHNTPSWIKYVSENEYQNEDWNSLDGIICNATYCSACFDINDNDINCLDCLLSKGNISCTPRSLYTDDYYRIVSNYINDNTSVGN